jgi:hypothetical protein
MGAVVWARATAAAIAPAVADHSQCRSPDPGVRRAADKALYAAKQAGRDRVVVYEAKPPEFETGAIRPDRPLATWMDQGPLASPEHTD